MMPFESAFARLNRMLLGIWAGALLFMGGVVAPVLFVTLPERQMAGNVAGVLFAYLDWTGIGLAFWFLLPVLRRRYRPAWLSWLAVILLLLVNRLLLAPAMNAIKARGPVDALPPGSADLQLFGTLHGMSSVIYLIVLLLVLWRYWVVSGMVASPERAQGS